MCTLLGWGTSLQSVKGYGDVPSFRAWNKVPSKKAVLLSQAHCFYLSLFFVFASKLHFSIPLGAGSSMFSQGLVKVLQRHKQGP